MQILHAECGHPRHRSILAALAAGAPAAAVAAGHGLQKATVQRIARTAARLQSYPLTLTDGITTLPIADVRTSRGFLHACRHALQVYSGTFDHLELPQWRLTDGTREVAIAALRAPAD